MLILPRELKVVEGWLIFNVNHAKQSCPLCSVELCDTVQKALRYRAYHDLSQLPEYDIIDILEKARTQVLQNFIKGRINNFHSFSGYVNKIITNRRIDNFRGSRHTGKSISLDGNGYVCVINNINNSQDVNENEKTSDEIDINSTDDDNGKTTDKIDNNLTTDGETENIYNAINVNNPNISKLFIEDASKAIEDHDLYYNLINMLLKLDKPQYVEFLEKWYELLKLNKKVSQQDVADQIGVSRKTVQRYLKDIKELFKKYSDENK